MLETSNWGHLSEHLAIQGDLACLKEHIKIPLWDELLWRSGWISVLISERGLLCFWKIQSVLIWCGGLRLWFFWLSRWQWASRLIPWTVAWQQYDDQLLGLKGKASTDFASGSSGARWEKRPVGFCDAAWILGFNPQNDLRHTLTRERRRRSWPALQTWCDLKALVSSAYFRPGWTAMKLHGLESRCQAAFATGMQRNSGKFALCSRRSLGWFRVQKGGVTG